MYAWQDATVAGFRAMGASHHPAAGAHLLAAAELLGSAEADDARAAAAQSNKGVAYLLLGRADRGENEFAAAEEAWTRCLASVATWDVELSGSSSAFHLGLAARNVDAFQNTLRRRIARCCEAGLAMVRFNRLLAREAPAADHGHTLQALLSDVLGPRSPEVRLLRISPATTASDSLYAEKAAELTSGSPSGSAEARSQRNVENAVAHTILLRPGFRFSKKRPAATDTDFSSSP